MTIAPEFIDDLDFPTPEIEPVPPIPLVGPSRFVEDFTRADLSIGPVWPYSKAATDKARAVIQEQQARNREADFERMLASQIYDEARRLGSGPYQECWCSPSRGMFFDQREAVANWPEVTYSRWLPPTPSKELVVLQPGLR